MPKIKTNRAAAKRFKKTGTGKLKRNKAYKSHILMAWTAFPSRSWKKCAQAHMSRHRSSVGTRPPFLPFHSS